MSDTREQIQELIDNNKVVLFMKGTRIFPQCGFSARSVEIFKRCGIKVKDVNVLADPAIRQGIKDFSNWPTIPQAYIDGKFVGGSDILLEMYENGELHKTLGVADESNDDATAPKLSMTAAAKGAMAEAIKDAGEDVLHFSVSPDFHYDLYFGPKTDSAFEVDGGGITILVPQASAARANGTTIDYVDGPDGAGFKIDNPNEPPRVKELAPADLKKWLDAGDALQLFDVRGDAERAKADIAGSTVLDDAALAALKAQPKDTKVVLFCHHGIRSRNASQQLIEAGMTQVFNLSGGIDAWSLQVDDTIARY